MTIPLWINTSIQDCNFIYLSTHAFVYPFISYNCPYISITDSLSSYSIYLSIPLTHLSIYIYLSLQPYMIHSQLHLVQHLSETLQSSQNPAIIRAVQKLISTAVKSSNSSILIKHSFISDIGFGGVSQFFRPFPKVKNMICSRRHVYKCSVLNN